MRSTKIRNGHANFFSVEDPTLGAGEADLVVPVPGSAARVGRLGVVGVRENAFSFLEVITLEASGAISVVSVGFALVRNRNTNAVSVEDPLG